MQVRGPLIILLMGLLLCQCSGSTAVTASNPFCVSKNASGGVGACTLTYDQCADGSLYELDCTGTDCSCQMNGQTMSTSRGSAVGLQCDATQDVAIVNATCGWALQ